MSEYKLMSFGDVAQEANLPLSTIYYLHRTGKGPVVTEIGRHLRVTREEFNSWLAKQKKTK